VQVIGIAVEVWIEFGIRIGITIRYREMHWNAREHSVSSYEAVLSLRHYHHHSHHHAHEHRELFTSITRTVEK
jgi:hypothetical protein